MNEFAVNSYSSIDAGSQTANNFSTETNTIETDLNTTKNILSDTSIFMEPIQENCLNELNSLEKDVESLTSAMKTLSTYLKDANSDYQLSDVQANKTIIDSTLSPEIASKKKAFIVDVDDASQYTVEGNIKTKVKHMTMFDNTTGEEIPEDGSITLKKGETRVITVKLPTDTGMIGNIVRTTAADTSNKGNYHGDTNKITSSRSDLDPDPNNIEYVNYKSETNHWPENKDLLHANHYDWIITADKVGERQISQTCEYTTDAAGNSYLKAMIGLNVKIVDEK